MREFSKYSAYHSTVLMSFGRYDGADVVTVGGCFDMNTHTHVRERILEHAAFTQPKLVLDLSDLGLLDSSGIGALVVLNRTLGTRGTELALVTSSTHLKKLFRIAGLDQVVEIHDVLENALAQPGDDSEPVSAS